MPVSVAILDGPLPRYEPGPGAEGAGAVVAFDGVVRGLEAQRPIEALDYAAYEPMAQTQLNRLAEEMVAKHGLLGIQVWHSRGKVPVGACSFRLVVHSAHRAEALAAMGEFIDRMKKDVPIWKRVPGT